MKKLIVAFIFVIACAAQSYAQRSGDLYFGLEGGYIPTYKDVAFGARASYSITDPFEVSFVYLMNPEIQTEDPDGTKSKIKYYSLSLDMHYYILQQRTWAMGPTLGGQYFKESVTYENNKTSGSGDSYGLNLGWHMRYNFGENVVLNGGWRYTPATNDNSHHLLYVGFGYRFNLFE